MKLHWPIRTQLFILVLAAAVPLLGMLAYTIYTGARRASAGIIKYPVNQGFLTVRYNEMGQLTSSSTQHKYPEPATTGLQARGDVI